MVCAGPGIQPGSLFPQLATNVDISPTLMALGGVDPKIIAESSDGRSFLPLLIRDIEHPSLPLSVKESLSQVSVDDVKEDWRKNVFMEYYYIGINPYCGMPQPIEDVSSNFIAVRHVDSLLGDLLYAEFQNGTGGNVKFERPDYYEMFDMRSDHWQMHNVYEDANATLKKRLHEEVQAWLACKGATCP